MNRSIASLLAAALALAAAHAAEPNTAQVEPFPVPIRVDATKSQGELRPIWRFIGADEPNCAMFKDGRELLDQQLVNCGGAMSISARTISCARAPGFRRFVNYYRSRTLFIAVNSASRRIYLIPRIATNKLGELSYSTENVEDPS